MTRSLDSLTKRQRLLCNSIHVAPEVLVSYYQFEIWSQRPVFVSQVATSQIKSVLRLPDIRRKKKFRTEAQQLARNTVANFVRYARSRKLNVLPPKDVAILKAVEDGFFSNLVKQAGLKTV